MDPADKSTLMKASEIATDCVHRDAELFCSSIGHDSPLFCKLLKKPALTIIHEFGCIHRNA